MNRYRIVRADGLFIPYLLVDLIDREYLARIFHQQKKDIVLNRRQLDGFSVHCHFCIVIIDLEAAALVHLPLILLRHIPQLRVSSELGLHPGYQLQGVKGLCDVIVRPDVEPKDFVRILRLC